MGRSSKTCLCAILAVAAAACEFQPKATPSSDARLMALALSSGSLSPAFSSDTFSYAAVVPRGTASVAVTAAANFSKAKSVEVSQDGVRMGTVSSGSASRALAVPAAGAFTKIALKVTAEDGATRRTYQISLTQAGNSDASLTSLTASAGTLIPAFSSAATHYTLAVPGDGSTVRLTPVASDSNIRSIDVALNGVAVGAVASGSATSDLSVPASGTTSSVTLVVTAQDGVATQTYTVAVKRTSPADASLSSLTASSGGLSPAFSSDTHSYTLALPPGSGSVILTPIATNPSVQSIAVSQDGGTPSSAVAPPGPGLTSIVTITVTAQDGSTTETYTVALKSASTDATLASIALSAGSLSPAFAAGTRAYTATVPHGTASVTVTPTAADSGVSSISVSQDGGAKQTIASGTASSALTVPAVGSTSVVSIVVTAKDGLTTGTYAITLKQAASSDATLAGLTDSSGNLTGFSTATLTYSYSVPFQDAAYTVTPTATDRNAGIQVNGISTASGSPAAVNLVEGSNTITIAVTSADGSATKSYVLEVTEGKLTPGIVHARTVPGTASPLATVLSGARAPNAAAKVPVDTLLRIGFDTPPTIGATGKIQIFKSNGTLVDVIDLADGPAYGAMRALSPNLPLYLNSMVNIIGGTASQSSYDRYVYYTPIAISGNTAVIFPHKNRLTYGGGHYSVTQTLDYGASYYVTIDKGVLNGAINNVSFAGMTDSSTWTFATKPAAPAGTTLSVNWDNTGDFATVQGAIDAVALNNSASYYNIDIAPGVYQELLFSANKNKMTFKSTTANNGLDTIIQYDNCDAFNNGVGQGESSASFSSTSAPNGGGRPVYLISGGDQNRLRRHHLEEYPRPEQHRPADIAGVRQGIGWHRGRGAVLQFAVGHARRKAQQLRELPGHASTQGLHLVLRLLRHRR